MRLDEVATVYGYDTDDRVPVTTTLACRMLHVSLQPAATTRDREEFAARRKLLFDPSFNMPETAQIQINGEDELWNTVPGTFARAGGPARVVRWKRCDLVRASDG